jgi:hypothetical protein
MMPRLAIGLVIAFASSPGLAPAGGAVGQEPAAPNATPDPQTDVRWVLTGSPHVDLWYHGVAVVGFEGIGPLPLYDPEYADRVRSARAESGASSSPLEANRDRFAMAFARDNLFEFLHFLPLYFAFSNRVAMWDAIRTVAQAAYSLAEPCFARPLHKDPAQREAGYLIPPHERTLTGHTLSSAVSVIGS